MSKKDYEAVAAVLKLTRDQAIEDGEPAVAQGVYEAALVVMGVFAVDNPRFDRERFMKAVTG